MSKRKHAQDVDSADEQTPAMIDVNFDYYNVDAGNDYGAIQRLLIQLFGREAEQVKTDALTDLVTQVAEESGVGSTIKTEEEEGSDPYAVLTVVSCRDHPGVAGVIAHVLSKMRAEGALHGALTSHLRGGHVGLVVSERVVNMPVQVMVPMYRLLTAEIAAAIEAGLDYAFTHLLFASRVYRRTPDNDDDDAGDERHPKRARGSGDAGGDEGGVGLFHAEDEEIARVAEHSETWLGDALGLRVAVVPAARLDALVASIEARYGESVGSIM